MEAEKTEQMKLKISNNLISILIIIAVIGIFVLFFVKNNQTQSTENVSDQVMRCIAGKSEVYVSTGCPHCAKQEEILGSSLQYFILTDCRKTSQECVDKNIQVVPTWIISGERYEGVRSIAQLRNLTGC